MVMYFQDDFWDAVTSVDDVQDQNAIIAALVRYHFTGIDDTSNSIAKAILSVCKDRIDLSKKRSKAGSKRKQTKSKTETNKEQNERSLSHSLSNSSSNNSQVDNQPGTDFLLEELETPFSVQCLKVINDVLDQDNYNVPRGYENYLDSMGQHYTVDQVETMVRHFKRSWENDKAMKDNLRANVLLNPKNFESYMQTSISAKNRPESFEDEQRRKNEEYINQLKEVKPKFVVNNGGLED